MRREHRELALEVCPVTRGAFVRFASAHERLEMVIAFPAGVFEKGHGSIIANGSNLRICEWTNLRMDGLERSDDGRSPRRLEEHSHRFEIPQFVNPIRKSVNP
jgi:hypothetical protein